MLASSLSLSQPDQSLSATTTSVKILMSDQLGGTSTFSQAWVWKLFTARTTLNILLATASLSTLRESGSFNKQLPTAPPKKLNSTKIKCKERAMTRTIRSNSKLTNQRVQSLNKFQRVQRNLIQRTMKWVKLSKSHPRSPREPKSRKRRRHPS